VTAREFGPIEDRPNSLWPPYTGDVYITREERQAALRDALRGIDLGEYDTHMMEWLAGWDIEQVAVVVSWIERARKAGA
jgi:hypothetical protein